MSQVASAASPRCLHYASIEADQKLWEQVPLFQCLPPSVLPELSACSRWVHFEPGQVIITQGEEGDAFFIIKDGVARVEVDGAQVSTLAAGDYFGEASLLHDEPRAATITAFTSLEALRITRAQFALLGLHERLHFPKREKINKRHRMLASGAAGVKLEAADDAHKAFRTVRQSVRAEAPQAPKVQACKVQAEALGGILCDRLHIWAFLFMPLGLLCSYMGWGAGPTFLANFLAIVPLAAILGQATEALSSHTGQLIGGLLNATFGNAVEMIMCVQAVKAGLISVVQGNLLGSVLSNLLLVLGMAIFASGVVRKSQAFNAKGAAANMTCQLVASISICLPTCFSSMSDSITVQDELTISRVCSLFLIAVYVMFLLFMLKTHADLFEDAEDESEADEGELSPTLATLLLVGCTVAVAACSEGLVSTIEEVSEHYGLSQAFIGVILLPIVGNAAEHATAVTAARKGMMDLALGIAVGSSTQIALFVVPCAVMFGWAWEQPMNLNFTVFETTCQMLTVFLVSQVLAHGETNWLHGAMLMTVYAFIAVQTLFIPNGVH